jgi:lipopolysaccharide biosynthesis glycosyltransferase
MDIVTCSDNRFILPTGVMMYSVCKNNPDTDIVFHVIVDDAVSQGQKMELKENLQDFTNVRIYFYTVDETALSAFPNIALETTITKATYYRLLLTNILPDTVQKVLYMDGDIIVRKSLAPLWNTDLTGYALAAVPDSASANIEYYNRLKYPAERGYFNAGVLLVNLDYWRQHDALRTFNGFIQDRADDIVAHDQDVLNCVFCDQKLTLPIKYDLVSGYIWKKREFDYWKVEQELQEALKDPVIIHFTGVYKPWYAYQRVPHPFNSTWDLYQDQTKWRGVKTDYRPRKIRLINGIADALRILRIIPQYSEYHYIEIAPID